MPNDLELLGDALEDLGDILSQVAQLAAAARAGALGGHRRMRDRLAREACGQRLTDRPALERFDRFRWRKILRLARFELLDRELELVDALIELLGGASVLGAPELGEHELEVLDLQIAAHESLTHRSDELL